MDFKKILLLMIFVKELFALFGGGGCPPCVCSEHSSGKSERVLIETQRAVMLKDIVPNLTNMYKEAQRLKKAETKQLELVKNLTALEYYKALKLKQTLKELQKQKNLLFLKIKEIQAQAKAQNIKNKIFLYKQK